MLTPKTIEERRIAFWDGEAQQEIEKTYGLETLDNCLTNLFYFIYRINLFQVYAGPYGKGYPRGKKMAAGRPPAGRIWVRLGGPV
jgi:hypothetical protein